MDDSGGTGARDPVGLRPVEAQPRNGRFEKRSYITLVLLKQVDSYYVIVFYPTARAEPERLEGHYRTYHHKEGARLSPEDLCLCCATVRNADFRQLVESAAANGFRAVSLWPHLYLNAREQSHR